MVAASLLTPKALDEKACRYNDLVMAALARENINRSMNVLRAGDTMTRVSVKCNFKDASARDELDNHVMLAIKDLLAEVRNRDMTGIESRFAPQALYAIDVLSSVSKMSLWEINDVLYPKPPRGQLISLFGRQPG